MVGAAWLDSLFLLIGPRGDGLDVEAVIAGHPLLRDVPAEHVDVVLALVVGYFLKSADEPVPPTSPYLRDAQRWQGEVCWDWLCERRGWAGTGSLDLRRRTPPAVTVVRRAGAHSPRADTRRRHPTDRAESSPVANIKSQIKRNKQNEKAHERNKAVKTGLKTAVRKFREAAEAGDADKAEALGRGRRPQAGQGRLQGRHPQEPGREPQVRDRQEGRLSLRRPSRTTRRLRGGSFCISGDGAVQRGSRRPVMVSTSRSRV